MAIDLFLIVLFSLIISWGNSFHCSHSLQSLSPHPSIRKFHRVPGLKLSKKESSDAFMNFQKQFHEAYQSSVQNLVLPNGVVIHNPLESKSWGEKYTSTTQTLASMVKPRIGSFVTYLLPFVLPLTALGLLFALPRAIWFWRNRNPQKMEELVSKIEGPDVTIRELQDKEIFECEKCGSQIKAMKGRASLLFARENWRCPRCKSSPDKFFNIYDPDDPRALKRLERLKAEEEERKSQENEDGDESVGEREKPDVKKKTKRR